MKVTVTTHKRFHSFHMARALYEQGALAGIFSGAPKSRLQNEKIPLELIHSYPYFQILSTLFSRYKLLPPSRDPSFQIMAAEHLDAFVLKRLPICDALVGLSGSSLACGRRMKDQGKVFVVDRGSWHAREQREVVLSEYSKYGFPYFGMEEPGIQREEAEYAIADAIFVPSTPAVESFVKQGVPLEKLRQIPYGVDLSQFYPEGEPTQESFDILFVGSISIRKGFPYLVDAFINLDHPKKSLTVIGSVEPCVTPWVDKAKASGATFLGTMTRPEIRGWMSRSHLMVLPSVEEGLAMVQAEALACGCPVAFTRATGGSDIITDGLEGVTIPEASMEAVLTTLTSLSRDPSLLATMRSAAVSRAKSMQGWGSYGSKVVESLAGLVAKG